MSTFFIIISLILNVVSLFIILILYLRQNRLFEVEKNQEKLLKEMEGIISSYLLEIREDNEQFINKIKEMDESRSKRMDPIMETDPTYSNHTQTNLKGIENIKEIEEKDTVTIRPVTAIRTQVAKAYKQNHRNDKKSNNDETNHTENFEDKKKIAMVSEKKSPIEEIILLQEQGFSNEEIARKLNKGKTEIQLLLKFHKRD